MDPELYNAARSGDVDFLQRRAADLLLLQQKTPKKSSILHIAAEFNQLEFFKKAVDLCPLTVRLKHANTTGDTALHFAAREGSNEMVEFIINYAKQMYSDIEEGRAIEGYKELLRMVNRDRDNALHLAAQYGHYEVAKLLVEADPEVSNHVNNAYQSPCFMATVREYTEIVELLLALNNPPCSLRGGANGMTALHAALYLYQRHRPKNDILKKIVNARPEMIREGDAIGWTTLHYAAYDGSVNVVEIFLECDSSATYLVGKKGESALHNAAFNGHVNVMKVLVGTRPDCWDLVDKKGRTALHAAVLGEALDAVEYILGFPGLKRIGCLADVDGNTPLHLAALKKSKYMIAILSKGKNINTQERSILFKATNKQNLTAIDIYDTTVNERLYGSLRRELDETIGLQRRHEKAIHQVSKIAEDEDRRRLGQERSTTTSLKDSLKLIKLTATLIATATFTAGFTMPGGYNQSGSSNEGMAVLASKAAFRAFLIFDIISFFSSMIVVYLQFSGIADKDFRERFPGHAARRVGVASAYFMSIAISTMLLAFTCGIYAVLVKSDGFGLASLILSLCLAAICLIGVSYIDVPPRLEFFISWRKMSKRCYRILSVGGRCLQRCFLRILY